MTNILELTKKLVSIPSWVDGDTNEIKVADFIFSYLKNNSQLVLQKELVRDGRYNILASNSGDINNLLAGHIDTVGVSGGWDTNPTVPVIKDGKLYGRGTTDMKSGVAAMMLLACSQTLPPNTGFLFYVDEEYSFLGMNQFIKDYGEKLRPKTIICLDGSDLEIANGCRGLIEIQFEVTGKTAHAGTPQNGKNAIIAGVSIFEKLKEYLGQFVDPELGATTANLGLINGGSAPNVVAGTCQLTFDIRPSTGQINAQFVTNKIMALALEQKVTINNLKINFDYGSWLTPQEKLKIIGLPFKKISQSGYFDTQLLWAKLDRPTSFTIGAGSQSTAHTANEYIEISKLERLPQILENIVQIFSVTNDDKIKL